MNWKQGEGDRNTSFLVKIIGSWLTEENEVRGGVVNEFKLLLSAAGGWKPNISEMSFERLEDVETARLEKSFSEQEVLEALKGFCGDKRLGLMVFLWLFGNFLGIL